jgi:hypothetical protein
MVKIASLNIQTYRGKGKQKFQIQKSSMMKKYFIGDDLLDFTGIPSQESFRVPPPLDTDQLRKKKCRNRTSAVKRRASVRIPNLLSDFLFTF